MCRGWSEGAFCFGLAWAALITAHPGAVKPRVKPRHPRHSLRCCSVLPGLPSLPRFGSAGALGHSPIMMPEKARTRAATRAEVTTERISESGRWGSGVGDTGRQVPTGHQ